MCVQVVRATAQTSPFAALSASSVSIPIRPASEVWEYRTFCCMRRRLAACVSKRSLGRCRRSRPTRSTPLCSRFVRFRKFPRVPQSRRRDVRGHLGCGEGLRARTSHVNNAAAATDACVHVVHQFPLLDAIETTIPLGRNVCEIHCRRP